MSYYHLSLNRAFMFLKSCLTDHSIYKVNSEKNTHEVYLTSAANFRDKFLDKSNLESKIKQIVDKDHH